MIEGQSGSGWGSVVEACALSQIFLERPERFAGSPDKWLRTGALIVLDCGGDSRPDAPEARVIRGGRAGGFLGKTLSGGYGSSSFCRAATKNSDGQNSPIRRAGAVIGVDHAANAKIIGLCAP